MKRCIDCKYFSNGGLMALIVSPLSREFAKCQHPNAFRYAVAGDRYITGRGKDTEVRQFYCATMRAPIGDCGPAGNLFVPKESS